MIIRTGQLCHKDQQYIGEEPVSILELEHDPFIRGGSPIRYDLTAQRLVNELLVRGTLEVEFTCLCSRCAELFQQPMRISPFVRAYALSAENESIDLTSDIREDILLSFPMNLVCSKDCRGLCPQCGANLNKRPCACDQKKKESAWNRLDQLKL